MNFIKTFGRMLQLFFVVIALSIGVTQFILYVTVAITDFIYARDDLFTMNPSMNVFSGLIVGMLATIIISSHLKRQDPRNQFENVTPLSDFFTTTV